MSVTHPKPATPLPWSEFNDFCLTGINRQDGAYIIRAANAFPHLVEALEMMLEEAAIHDTGRMKAHRALAIARGETPP